MTDIENEVLKKEQIRNQFESLKQNMSPHFLFNSLSTLQVLISEDADEAKHYVGHLSSLLRYALQSNVNDLISLAEEINLADAFIFMLRIRYGKNLNIEMNIDPSAKMKKIPPLTLQILLENAVKHNEISKQFPLKIRIEANADKLLTVENNIRIKLTPESSTGTGLPNLSKRYRIISGRDIAVSKENDHFMVAVPLLDE